jgi:hypothetical protein
VKTNETRKRKKQTEKERKREGKEGTWKGEIKKE